MPRLVSPHKTRTFEFTCFFPFFGVLCKLVWVFVLFRLAEHKYELHDEFRALFSTFSTYRCDTCFAYMLFQVMDECRNHC